ncbi:hypothetical protein MNEG_1771, partial [Monoraphidium neglectum]
FVFREGRTKGIGVIVACQGDSPDSWDDAAVLATPQGQGAPTAPGAGGGGQQGAGCGAEVAAAAAGGGAAPVAGCRVSAP